MARVSFSVSCLPEDKAFLDKEGVSPSKLFQEAIQNLRITFNQVPEVTALEKDFGILRKYFVQSTRTGKVEIYQKALNVFLQKYPDWTKAEVMARVERPRYVNLNEEKKVELEG